MPPKKPQKGTRPPEGDRPVANPHEHPDTPFSASRAAGQPILNAHSLSPDLSSGAHSFKSNAEVLEALTTAGEMRGPDQASFIGAQITWWDAMGDEKRPAMLHMGRDKVKVSGGRLGRDHTLEDVPNHFVRDMALDYIDTMLEERLRDKARKAVFPDLSSDELKEYSALLAQQKEDLYSDSHKLKPVEERVRALTAEEGELVEKIDQIIGNYSVKSTGEADSVIKLARAMAEIDEDIDMRLQPNFGFRHFDYPEPISHTVMSSRDEELWPDELKVHVGTDIDRDCDQIRAIIVRFIRTSGWTVDAFRHVLGGISRPQLTAFLKKRGPNEGAKTTFFQLAWEFFKKRELLGIPVKGTTGVGVLRERDANRGKKRARTGAEKEATAKRTKTWRRKQHQEASSS